MTSFDPRDSQGKVRFARFGGAFLGSEGCRGAGQRLRPITTVGFRVCPGSIRGNQAQHNAGVSPNDKNVNHNPREETMSTGSVRPTEVRQQLTDALYLDLVGPAKSLGTSGRSLGDLNESLPQRPSAWYLTGFLVPLEADASQRADEQSADELDEVSDSQGSDDAVAPEPGAARLRYLPSSMGVSVLVPAEAVTLKVMVRWGDYEGAQRREEAPRSGTAHPQRAWSLRCPNGRISRWNTRCPSRRPDACRIGPGRSTDGAEAGLPEGTRSVSVFLVNRHHTEPDEMETRHSRSRRRSRCRRRAVCAAAGPAEPAQRRLGRAGRRSSVPRCLRVRRGP